jgi:hypothetical protein
MANKSLKNVANFRYLEITGTNQEQGAGESIST